MLVFITLLRITREPPEMTPRRLVSKTPGEVVLDMLPNILLISPTKSLLACALGAESKENARTKPTAPASVFCLKILLLISFAPGFAGTRLACADRREAYRP